MGQAANIVINDGQASPASHTFAYVPYDGNIAGFEDRSPGIPIGYNRITISLRRPRANVKSSTVASRNYRAVVKIETPKLETVSNSTVSGVAPAPTLSYRPMCTIEFVLPERSALTDRKDLLAYVKNALANTQVTNLIHDFDPPF